MNKKMLWMFSMVGILVFSATSAGAILITLQQGVVQDDNDTDDVTDDKYWLQDLSIFANQTYYEQIEAINTFSTQDGDWGDWHMAGLDEMNMLFSHTTTELIDSFHPTVDERYCGRWDWLMQDGGGNTIADYGCLYLGDYGTGQNHNDFTYYSDANAQYSFIGAWVVATVTPASVPVPEPAAMLLLITGIIGFFGVKIGRKKNKYYVLP